MNYSLAQAGNLSAIIGVITLLLKIFQINIAEEEIQTLIGGILAVAGVVVSWFGRYRKGDLTKLGFRK
mgnify:CR=1 FL=1